MKKTITLVILAAGEGKRFWPFVTDKNLFPFLDKSLFDYAMPKDFPEEISECVIVTSNHNRDFFVNRTFPVPVTVVVQERANGMAGAVLAAKKEISGKSIMIMIADDLADSGLMSAQLSLAKPDVFGVLTVWKPKSYYPGGYVVFREDRPIGIREKPGEGKTPSDYVYFGGQFMRDADALIRALESIKQDTDDVYEQALTSLMKEYRFAVYPYEERFVSLKYPWHVLDIMDHVLASQLKAGRGKQVDIHNNVSIEGTVYLGNNVKIMENTKIVGPVYIGDGTIIGNNNIIRNSYIGPQCVTGFNTDITRSYIGDHCWFHSNYIGDSVLEGNISMGSGSVLANLRLDEGEISSVVSGSRLSTHRNKLGAMIARDVRIGVNVSIMPGVKIGSNSMIGAGVVLDSDIPEGSFCVAKSGFTVMKNTKSIGTDRSVYKAKL